MAEWFYRERNEGYAECDITKSDCFVAKRFCVKRVQVCIAVTIGFDLGFKKAGFNIVWGNEYDNDIWETYERIRPKTYLCRKSVCDIDATKIPECNNAA